MAKVISPQSSAGGSGGTISWNPNNPLEAARLGLQQLLQFLELNPNLGPQGSSYPISPPGIANPHIIVPMKQEEHEQLLKVMQETLLLQAETAKMKAETEHLQAQAELEQTRARLKQIRGEDGDVETTGRKGRGSNRT
jgi:hypothetical protein